MSYITTKFGRSNEWNTEGGPNDTDLSVLQIKATSTANRLDMFAEIGADRWDVTAFGHFQLDNKPTTVANLLSAQVTSLQILNNGQPEESIDYAPGFDFIRWLMSYDYRYSLLGGNDAFTGSLDNPTYGDEVRGGRGNDHFTGNKDGIDANGRVNYDSFFGESGLDTAHYRGAFNDYQLSFDTEIWDGRYQTQTRGLQVKDSVVGRDGTDWLKEVERLQFSDVSLALDTGKGEIAGSAYRLYKAAFDRLPEAEGLGFWINTLDQGADLVNVALGFINSDEFRVMYGANPTDQQFVTLLYNHVLHRPPEGEGYQFWLNSLSAGVSRAQVLKDFSESTENINQTAELIANGIQFEAWVA